MKELKADLIKRLLASTPDDLPEDVDSEFITGCFAGYEHIFYDKKQRIAYCTVCQDRIPDEYKAYKEGAHNEEGHCPVCCSEITYKCIGRMRDKRPIYWRPLVPAGTYYNINLLVMQKANDDYFVLRRFAITKVTKACGPWTEMKYAENQRVYFNGIKRFNMINRLDYSGESYWQESKRISWDQPDDWNGFIKPIGEFCYLKNTWDLIQGTYLQYAKQYEGMIDADRYHPDPYLCFLSLWRKPMEYLCKAGLTNFARSMQYSGNGITGKEISISQILKVPSEYIPLIKKHNMRTWEVNAIKKMIKGGVKKIDYSMIQMYSECSSALKTCQEYSEKLTIKRFMEYMQKLRNKQIPFYRIRQYYCDYLHACAQLGYDMSRDEVLFPIRLMEDHDRETKRLAEYQAEKRKHEFDDISMRYKSENEFFAWHQNGLFIRMVRDYKELIKEGSELCHCVGTYAERVKSGRTTILVIRKVDEPEKPYITLEYQKGLIVQYHGYKNEREGSIPKEVRNFVKNWETEVHRREARSKRQAQKVACTVAV